MTTVQDRIFTEFAATVKESGVMNENATNKLCSALRTGKKPKVDDLIAALLLPLFEDDDAKA